MARCDWETLLGWKDGRPLGFLRCEREATWKVLGEAPWMEQARQVCSTHKGVISRRAKRYGQTVATEPLAGLTPDQEAAKARHDASIADGVRILEAGFVDLARDLSVIRTSLGGEFGPESVTADRLVAVLDELDESFRYSVERLVAKVRSNIR